MQQAVGLRVITDGEYRRTNYHLDFLQQLAGVQCDPPVTVRKADGMTFFLEYDCARRGDFAPSSRWWCTPRGRCGVPLK